MQCKGGKEMDSKRRQIIANNITKYRKEKGITQKELAKIAGVTPSTMSDYMNLRSAPSHGVIQKIADYFEIKKSDIDTTYKENDLDSISTIYEQLEQPRKKKVYNYAEYQLKEQQNNSDDLLIAAHMDDDLSEDEQQQVNDFIEKLKREQNK